MAKKAKAKAPKEAVVATVSVSGYPFMDHYQRSGVITFLQKTLGEVERGQISERFTARHRVAVAKGRK